MIESVLGYIRPTRDEATCRCGAKLPVLGPKGAE